MNVTMTEGFRSLAGLPTMRQKVERLHGELLKLPQAECPVEHHHGPGFTLRVITVPAGVAITGADHTTTHGNIVARGCIEVAMDDGVRHFRAGDVFIAQPGPGRAGVAIEETVWVNVFPNPTNERDLKTFIESVSAANYEDLLEVRALLAAPKQELIGG